MKPTPQTQRGDVASSPRASHRDLPSSHVDTARDLIIEPFLTHRGPIPEDLAGRHALFGRLLDAGLAECRDANPDDLPTSPETGLPIVRALQVLASIDEWQLSVAASCYLRLLGQEPRSLEEIGAPFGKCRAAVHIIFRKIQDKTGLRTRGDKSDASRAECRRRREGARKPRIDSFAESIWRNPLPLPPLLLPPP